MTEMGTHEAGHAALSREGSPRRRWLIAASTAVVLVTVAVRIGFASKSSDSGSIDGETVDSTASPAAVSPSLSVPSERRYSDLELGLDAVIEEEIMPFYARYRSFADWEEPYEERQPYLDEEAVGHERERLYFERNLEVLIGGAYEDLPLELGRAGTLDRAYDLAMEGCADAAGWPGLKINVSSKAAVDDALAMSGLTYEGFLDLRHECAKQAATYPTLDPVVRDELLGRLREHYRAAVYEYLREFPDAEVPLVDHEGAPRSLEDALIDTCLKDPDPAACAVEFRVELPATE